MSPLAVPERVARRGPGAPEAPEDPAAEVDGWFQAEQSIRQGMVAELRRLVRRAKSRWWLVVLIAAALTAGVLYKRAKKVHLKTSKVVLAVSEGALADGHVPMPAAELKDYIWSVLLSDSALQPVIEEENLFPLRRKQGIQYALNELRDMIGLEVFQNYFLAETYDPDTRRSARIALAVSGPNGELNWRLVHRLAHIIVDTEAERRGRAIAALAADAAAGLETAQAQVVALDQRVADLGVATAAAEELGKRGVAAARKVEMAEAEAQLRVARTRLDTITHAADADEMTAAIDRAGLGMSFDIVAERRTPDEEDTHLYFQIILGALVFCVMVPIVTVFIGAFDSRIHDREDASRIGMPVLGHVPAFPGDGVGSLRARGVRGRRVPS